MKRVLMMTLTLLSLGFALAAISTACSKSAEGKQTRFTGDNPTLIIDHKYGCEYIRSGGYSSWTYVHGSCPEVIKSEQAE